jgi:hypothetical protein
MSLETQLLRWLSGRSQCPYFTEVTRNEVIEQQVEMFSSSGGTEKKGEKVQMLRALGSVVAAGLLSACATIPDVEYSYYPAKSNTLATVIQSVDCTSDKTAVVVVNTPSVTTAYSSDTSKAPFRTKIKDVEGDNSVFADSDMSFGFFDDGRLKSINQSTTGQGETILKAAVSLAAAIAPLGGGPKGGEVKAPLPECDTINSFGGGKAVSLTYTGGIDSATPVGVPVPLVVAPGSKQLYEALRVRLPVLAVQIKDKSPIESRATYAVPTPPDSGVVVLTLQKTSNARVEVTADGGPIFSGSVAIPETGTYPLPISKAALFGKEAFALTLSEAGTITAIDYGKSAGAAGALNVAGAIATASTPQTTASQAADVKAQADLIAQQQRLVRCQAKPAQCQ